MLTVTIPSQPTIQYQLIVFGTRSLTRQTLGERHSDVPSDASTATFIIS